MFDPTGEVIAVDISCGDNRKKKRYHAITYRRPQAEYICRKQRIGNFSSEVKNNLLFFLLLLTPKIPQLSEQKYCQFRRNIFFFNRKSVLRLPLTTYIKISQSGCKI